MHRLFNSNSVRNTSIVSAALVIGVSFFFKKNENKPLSKPDESLNKDSPNNNSNINPDFDTPVRLLGS